MHTHFVVIFIFNRILIDVQRVAMLEVLDLLNASQLNYKSIEMWIFQFWRN